MVNQVHQVRSLTTHMYALPSQTLIWVCTLLSCSIDPVNDYCLCPLGPQGPQGPTGPKGKIVNYDPFSKYFSFQLYFVWPSLEVCTVFRALLPKRCSRYTCQRQASLVVRTYLSIYLSIYIYIYNMLQNLETALFGLWGFGQMSLVNEYQTCQPNLGSSLVVVKYRAWWLIYQ